MAAADARSQRDTATRPWLTAAIGLSPDDSATALAAINKRLGGQKERRQAPTWGLEEEIHMVPAALWARAALEMASPWRKQALMPQSRLDEKRGGASQGKTWPLCSQGALRLQAMPSQRLALALSAWISIEHRASARSPKRPGPLTTTFGASALLQMSATMQPCLSRVGVCLSYEAAGQIRGAAAAASKRQGILSSIAPHGAAMLATDNFNLSFGHKLALEGSDASVFKGATTQLPIGRDGLPSLKPPGMTEEEWRSPRALLSSHPTAAQFVANVVPTSDSPSIKSFSRVLLGLCRRHKGQLISEDSATQLSMSRLLPSALQGFAGDGSEIVCVDLTRRPCEKTTLIDLLRTIKLQYRPGEPGRCTHVAVIGDQPVFKILLELWHEDLRAGGGLSTWMAPMPGGFHIDKQGIVSCVKYALAGAGLEELLAASGLSRCHQANFHQLTHYRKNSRTMRAVATATAIRLGDVVLQELPDALDSLDALSDSEIRASPESEAQKDLRESGLLLTDLVTPSILETGEVLRKGALELAEMSSSAAFHVRTCALECLIPFCGFYFTHRCGQTQITSDYWFYILNVLHATSKFHYQELALCHAAVLAMMPLKMKSELLQLREGSDGITKPGAWAVAMGRKDSKHGSLQIDEALEAGINAKMKMVPLRQEASALEDAIHWIQFVGAAADKLKVETRASRSGIGGRYMETTDEDLLRLSYDREAKTARTVAKMLEMMEGAGHLSAKHLAMPGLVSVLASPPTHITDPEEAHRLVSISSVARASMRLHAHTRLPTCFGPLPDSDVQRFYAGKAPRSRASKALRVRSMRELSRMCCRGLDIGIGKKRKRKEESQARVAKRRSTILRVRGVLEDI